jgi:exopolyphosphatase/pppGpp-phosphohydrolase
MTSLSFGVFMQHQLAPVRAAIDIGSNTIHLVVARTLPTSLDILVDEEEMVRIGESVNATGSISPAKLELTIATLRNYLALAQHYAAKPVLVVATEAIRQAKNSQEFLADILRETGLEVHLIEGNAEATLTFFGATYELLQTANPPSTIGVLDLGGGSMELVTAHQQVISWRTSVPIGSGWLHDRYLASDPPTIEDREIARAFLATYFDGLSIKDVPPMLIATGGSANSLWYLVQNAFPEQALPWHLSLEQLARCEELLWTLSFEQVADRYQQSAKRAKVLPAGLLIIQALMGRFGLKEIQVSPHGIREGALLAYARYGDAWLEKVTESGESTEEKDPLSSDSEQPTEEEKRFAEAAFSKTGQKLLFERLQTMLEWKPEVLKHKDVEAVHRMRVASRRLRAVMDAYEVIGKPRQFKKAYQQIQAIADMLGKARDTDVMLENLFVRLDQVDEIGQAGIHWLIERLQTYRKQHQQRLEAFLVDLDDRHITQQFSDFLAHGGAHDGKG